MSKKAFKRAAGTLYRQRLVELSPRGITWVGGES
jgi:predicted RNA-binding protein (virulence factor B family)